MSAFWNLATIMGHASNWEVDIFAYAHLDIQVKNWEAGGVASTS